MGDNINIFAQQTATIHNEFADLREDVRDNGDPERTYLLWNEDNSIVYVDGKHTEWSEVVRHIMILYLQVMLKMEDGWSVVNNNLWSNSGDPSRDECDIHYQEIEWSWLLWWSVSISK